VDHKSRPASEETLCIAFAGYPVALQGTRDTQQSPFVDFASVTDARHLHQQFCVVDGVHHAVVARAKMRHSRLPPCSFLHPAGRGLEARFSNRGTIRAPNWFDSLLSSSAALDVNVRSYRVTEPSALAVLISYLESTNRVIISSHGAFHS